MTYDQSVSAELAVYDLFFAIERLDGVDALKLFENKRDLREAHSKLSHILMNLGVGYEPVPKHRRDYRLALQEKQSLAHEQV